jgi:hypothetical protein
MKCGLYERSQPGLMDMDLTVAQDVDNLLIDIYADDLHTMRCKRARRW